MGHHYFFTGFPGFISNQLIRELVDRDDKVDKVSVLVLPQQREKAEEELVEIGKGLKGVSIHFNIVSGDITKDMFGLNVTESEDLRNDVTHVFHLAAIYDLAVDEKTAELVNVQGTANVNKWVLGIKQLKRYVYFSTAYVAGMREGKLYEHELVQPPGFKNHYERTKFDAELSVEKLKEQIPVTIIRPGIVKGHSKTGETIKFDGPYFILNFLDRLGFLPIYPYIGGKTESVVNLVPVDYIIQATAYLALYREGAGKTYHLTDPKPYQANEIYSLFVQELYNRKPKGRIPQRASSAFLSIKPVRVYLGVEKEALEYFTWNGKFDNTQAQKDLTGSGITCPDFKDGVPAMVDFYLKHKKDKRYQIRIR